MTLSIEQRNAVEARARAIVLAARLLKCSEDEAAALVDLIVQAAK